MENKNKDIEVLAKYISAKQYSARSQIIAHYRYVPGVIENYMATFNLNICSQFFYDNRNEVIIESVKSI